jgi:hypothetical protein
VRFDVIIACEVEPLDHALNVSLRKKGANVRLKARHFRHCSCSSRNEARQAGFHHCIQPLSRLNSIDFVKRFFSSSAGQNFQSSVSSKSATPSFGGLSKTVKSEATEVK